MYAVRRPGRPLTQCPHKDPRSCECDGLSEVIVKVKKDEGQDGGKTIREGCSNKPDQSAPQYQDAPVSKRPR